MLSEELTAAFDLALLHRNRYFLLKTAYDERLRKFAPGLVLRRAVVQRCFGLELKAHEFLGIDMEWKRLFANAERSHSVCHLYPGGRAGPSATSTGATPGRSSRAST